MRSLNLQPKIIIFDTEFTAWEGSLARNWNGPGEYREIIQIGAILVDTQNLQELDFFNEYIKPTKNPKLSDYITKLTGITQELIEKQGIEFSMALQNFFRWSQSYPLYTYGRDHEHLAANCKLADIIFPFAENRFHRLRDVFENAGVATANYDSGYIVEAFGQKISRPPHNAINDVRTLADGLRALSKRFGT